VQAPQPEAPSPPIPPNGGVARDRTAPPTIRYTEAIDDQNPLQARGNNAEADAVAADTAGGIASLAASVRIRVIHNGQVHLGSGTLILSQRGRSLVITCGHLFRDIDANAKIEVDVFSNGQPVTYVCELNDFDLESEVGLVSIPTDHVLPVARIVPANRIPQVHEKVASIGCSGHENPSREQHRITAVNKYEGPDNLECTGTPVQGRSGGGLFNAQEELVGICFSAGVDEPLGLYAGPAAMYAMLDKFGLQALYTPSAAEEPIGQPSQQVALESTTGEPFARSNQPVAEPAITLGPPSQQPLQPFAGMPDRGSAPDAGVTSTTPPLDFDAGDAEVVCLITQADGSRRVVVLHRASPKFVAYLDGELDGSESLTVLEDGSAGVMELTAQRVPRPEQNAVMTYAVASQQQVPRAYTTEGFRTTSLEQPMQPRPYVRRR
jgi:hypothetical protein